MPDFLDLSFDAGEACLPSPATANHAPDDASLAALLARTRTVAVVGLSPRPERTSHGIGAWLQQHSPYELFWVNPKAAGQTVLGLPVYESLDALPVVPDMVDVFRRSESVPPVVDGAIAVGAMTIWMQLGVVNDEAATVARAAGLDVIQNRCIKVEYSRLRPAIEAARKS